MLTNASLSLPAAILFVFGSFMMQEEKDRGGGKHAALFLLGIDTATQTPVPAIRTGPALKVCFPPHYVDPVNV